MTISVTKTRLGGSTVILDDGIVVADGHGNMAIKCVWDQLTTTGDIGAPVPFGQFADRTVQVEGTGFGTVVIEGSLDGTNYHTLNDVFGNALSFSAAGLKSICEFTGTIRPRCTSGSGASLVVTLECHGNR